MRPLIRRAAIIVLATGALHPSARIAAAATRHPASLICQLVLHEERLERDDLDLSLQLALTQMRAAGRIHTLLDDLWKKQAVERLVYLRGKHDWDTARIDHDRARLLLERQEAALEQYRLVCAGLSEGAAGDSGRRAVEEAYRRYGRASCEIHSVDEQRAEVDLAFFQEVLQSTRDLRVNDVATEQDVILSERNVEMARQRLEQARLRVARCGAGTPDAPPPSAPSR